VTLVNKSDDGLTGAIRLTTAWAIVPGAVTLAWLAARQRCLAWLIGVPAALSGFFVGALYSWSASGIFDSVMPSVAILVFGYPRATLPQLARSGLCWRSRLIFCSVSGFPTLGRSTARAGCGSTSGST
jgi:hypothetical protein